MPIENPYAKRLPSDRIGRIRTGGAGGSGRTPHPAAGAALSLDSAAIAAASASAPAPAASAASAPSGRANSSTAALHHHQCQPNHNNNATAQPARSSAQAQPPAAPTAPQPQLPPKLQQPPQLPPKQQPPQQSLPYHARLPSRRVSFSAAEVVSVSELARCLPTLQLATTSIDAGGDGNNDNHSANKAARKGQGSVRLTGVVLHVDLPGRFVLVGDGAAGARPSLAEASTANRGRGIGAGAGAVGMGAGLAGRGLGRGVGGIGRGIGGIGIGKGIGMGIPSTAKKTPLNRYARTSMGGSIGSMGSGRGIGSAAERTSLGGSSLPPPGTGGPGTGTKGLGNRSRKSSSAGIGGSIGSNGNNGLLHTAKKRKLVYTGGKKPAAAAATASAGIATATATGSGIGAGTGIAGGAAMATPRQGGLPSSSRRSFPGAARGTAIGRSILRTPRTTGIGSSMGGSSKRPIRPPSTLGPGAAALEVLRQQKMRGVTQAIVAVDIASMMPLEANVGWKVGDTVTVFGEVRWMVADTTTAPVPAATSTTASSATADAPADAPSEEATERPSAPPTTASQTPPSALQLVLSALETNGRGITARIIRNTNGTDVHLLAEALRLRRKHVRERCAGWPPTGGTSVALGVPGIGVEALTGKFHKMANGEEKKDGMSGE